MTDLILVVDDDYVTRMQLRLLLERVGYRVAEAIDGEQAIYLYQKLHPDLVLLDVLMSGMDGFACCTRLQTLPGGANTPILMITALDDEASVVRAFAAGATDYITKPIQWEVLRQRVRRLLENRRTIQELRQQSEQAQTQEMQLRMALVAAKIGVWDWDITTDLVTWSDNKEAMFGLEKGSFDGTYETFITCVHPEDRDFVSHSIKQAVESGTECDIEFRAVLPDGSIRWMASRGKVFHDSSGVAVRMCGVDLDISDFYEELRLRKQVEAALEINVRQQALLAEFSQRALAGTDLHTLMNSAVSLVAKCLQVEYCKVLELQPDGNSLLLTAGVGWHEGLVGNATVDTRRNSQAGYTLVSKEPVVVEDLSVETRFQGPQLLQDHRVVSGVSVVINGKERPFGVLGIHTSKRRHFSRDDIYFLQAIANVLATAIERHRVEEALKESEQRWQLALRGNNDGIWDWNVKTNEVFFSARWKEMLGYEEQEIGNHVDEWAKRVHPDDIGWVMQLIQDHFHKKTPFYISEHRVLCKDGTYKWILDRGQALWNQKGEVIRMTGSHTDITERKRVEQELQHQKLRSQLFADITVKIRQSLNIDEILQTSVTEVQKLLQADRVLILRLSENGVTAVQEAVVPGFPVVLGENIIDPCFQADYIEKYGQGRINAINDIQKADIQPCHVELLQRFAVKANVVVPILRQNQLWGLLIAHQCAYPREWNGWETEILRQLADQIGVALTQAKSLEQEIRQRQELTRSNQELQQFAFVASHDLQEPLRKIKTFADRLKATCKDALTPQGQDYLARMQNAASRMQILIEDLLALSRVTTRGQPFIQISLNKITQEVLSDLEVRIQQTGGRVEVGDLPTINADPIQMRQLLQNLIGNALKFHRQEVPPVVKVYSQDCKFQSDPLATVEFCQLVVEDNGIGFDEKYGDRIFNVFQRLHGRSEYEGTGIGLAICRKIAERHHGSITASSEPGEGATFTVTLPINFHP
ncbi:MAG: PAS domain-containing protein [Nostocaceae cyanobacterium]|nr:PAS domain-containing protein [Nostocaceae cyanobacterium]